jgi:ring-1,2-phenylacetyl-CoA epoxidase subunit PaaC
MEAIKDLLYKMADDQLIIGHRYSEWTGIGPVIEEDIAFASLAQDKIGHALALYTILHDVFEEDVPDKIAFTRNAGEFHNTKLAELPIQGFDFEIIRHFLFDFSEYLRFQALSNSSHERLAKTAKKFVSEIKYHILHGETWVNQLGNGTEESKARLQNALNKAFPLAIAVFEKGDFEQELIDKDIFIGEAELKTQWLEKIGPILEKAGLRIPLNFDEEAGLGGRKGIHTEHLQPLLDEMTEVFALEPEAEW